MSAEATAADASLRIDGELTIYRAAELCETLKAALSGQADGAPLRIDLSDVTEMDSAGVQLLLSSQKSARAAGRELLLSGCSPAVVEVFRTLRLESQFAAGPAPANV